MKIAAALSTLLFVVSTTVFGPALAAEGDGLVNVQKLIAEARTNAPKISTDELKKMVDGKEEFVLLDVRTPSEIASMGKIDATQQTEIPRGWVEVQILNHVVDMDTPIVAYCGGGIRSAFATNRLKEMGFTNVRNYDDGFFGWKKQGIQLNNLQRKVPTVTLGGDCQVWGK